MFFIQSSGTEDGWWIGIACSELLNYIHDSGLLDARVWDAQIETDAKGGKLDALIAEALAEHKAGKTREL